MHDIDTDADTTTYTDPDTHGGCGVDGTKDMEDSKILTPQLTPQASSAMLFSNEWTHVQLQAEVQQDADDK